MNILSKHLQTKLSTTKHNHQPNHAYHNQDYPVGTRGTHILDELETLNILNYKN